MTDEESMEINSNDFFADIAARLIEGDYYTGRAWRIGYGLTLVLDSLATAAKNESITDETRAWASNMLVDIVNALLYVHVHEVPAERDIDSTVAEWSTMLDRAEEFRKNKNESNEGE